MLGLSADREVHEERRRFRDVRRSVNIWKCHAAAPDLRQWCTLPTR
jgi:hypothetical protein